MVSRSCSTASFFKRPYAVLHHPNLRLAEPSLTPTLLTSSPQPHNHILTLAFVPPPPPPTHPPTRSHQARAFTPP
jgi:hypothetical protein